MNDANLTDLPHDVLRHILRLLNVRSLLSLACTCRTLAALSRDVPLHPVMTTHTRMLDWLALPHVAARVLSLTARCSLWGRCPFVGGLGSLRRLTITFGHVTAPIVRHLPESLEHLELHRLDCEYGDVFDTKRLTRLTRLRTLQLTFTPHWDMVILDSLDALTRLERLSLRLAPTLLVRAPIRVADVRLHSVSAFVCAHPIFAERLSLECTDSVIPLDLVVTPAAAPGIRDLALACPNRVTVPSLEHLRALEHLRLRYDCVLLPLRHLAAIATLRTVELDTRYGVAAAGTNVALSPGVRVSVSVAGVPMSPGTARTMFFGGAPRS